MTQFVNMGHLPQHLLYAVSGIQSLSRAFLDILNVECKENVIKSKNVEAHKFDIHTYQKPLRRLLVSRSLTGWLLM